jgi:ABC-2 type transport system permease protein
MKSLFRKEILHFLGSLTGYLAIVAFLGFNGLFIWIIPGNYNIPENGYASLEPFFQLAPWLYLFLIPALTMRFFAEEKKNGTIELLLTRPVSDFQLVFSKFLAGMTLMAFTLLPTLFWFFSVYHLGNPVGNLDWGSTWGAFIGLFLLASVYISIGLFSSVLSDNQIVAFIIAVLLSFLFFLGFEFVADTGIPYFLQKLFSWLSINEHYLSVSRGVIDLKDTLYFTGLTAFFIFLTMMFLRKNRVTWPGVRNRIIGLCITILIFAVVSEHIRYRIDLTSDKRYSLSPLTKKIARSLDAPVTIDLFLAGELPAGFRKLQQAIVDKVKDLNIWSGQPVRIVIKDPYQMTSAEKRSAFFSELEAKGIKPVDLRQSSDKGISTTRIFPGAWISIGHKSTSVSFLKNNPGLNHEVNLNHSLESVEYELVCGLKRLTVLEKPELVFLQGHNELNRYEVRDIAATLSESYRIEFKETKELTGNSSVPGTVIIAGPEEPFSESDKFVLDQLVMKGCRLMWLIDPVEVSLDSLSRGFVTLAMPRDLHLSDQLFHYGIRLNSDLLQDISCASILVNTSGTSDRPHFTPQSWYYSPLLTPSGSHPVSRNLNLIYSEFVSSIDTIGERGDVRATVILSTSGYGRRIKTPAAVSLESINNPPARELFNRPYVPAGVLLEGHFTSVFRNRMLNNLGINSNQVLSESPESKMVVFADANMIANKVRYKAGEVPEILPLGYDMVSQQTFGNKELMVNTVQYLNDGEGITQLRNTSLKLRLLDKVKLREEGSFWKSVNMGIPVLIVLVFGGLFHFIRKRKYSVQIS